MITFEEAYRIVMDSVKITHPESISLSESCGRILAEDIFSDMDLPPFNRSAVDGYACHVSEINRDLEIVEIIPAGHKPSKSVGSGQCSKIMTGAIVPDGCDMVIMVEDTEQLPSGKIKYTGKNRKINLSFQGEDVRKGEIVLKRNRLIRPQDIAVMATVGAVRIKAWRMPVAGILSTGDELVCPSEVPGISQIRNSNSFQLVAQVKRAGAIPVNHGIAPDNEKVTLEMINKIINESDLVIITGGVSMGDFDFVPSVLKRAGVRILFNRVNVQPGKPTVFGLHPKAVVFGLPGNPVSSFVQFETLIRPMINKMMMHEWKPLELKLPMAENFERKSSERMGWIPVQINDKSEVVPVNYHGSAHISALPVAYGLIAVSAGRKTIKKGEIVSVREI
jgi:molybdopterin molybdotransferase